MTHHYHEPIPATSVKKSCMACGTEGYIRVFITGPGECGMARKPCAECSGKGWVERDESRYERRETSR